MSQVLGYTNELAELRGYSGPARVSSWGPYDGFERAASGLYLPGELTKGAPPGWPPTAIDLFAGCGGMSLGIHQAGFHVVAALEYDFDASMTYLINLGSPTTRIYIPDSQRKAAFLQRARKEAKRNPKPRQGWIGPNGEAEPEPFPWQDLLPVDHGDYVTWPGAGTGYLQSARRQRARKEAGVFTTRELTWNGEEPNEFIRKLNEVRDDACLEPCQAFFIMDAREATGQQLLDGINAATGWKMRRGDVGLVVGGPPCQGFSTAGRRDIHDPRNSLVFEFARLVCEIYPKSMCMENVPEVAKMVTPDGELVIDVLTRILEEGGMGIRDNLRQVIETTAGVGVAQRGVRRGGEEKPKGETRGDRRRRVAEERKAAKKAAKNGGLVTDDLFERALPQPTVAVDFADLEFDMAGASG